MIMLEILLSQWLDLCGHVSKLKTAWNRPVSFGITEPYYDPYRDSLRDFFYDLSSALL